MVKKIVIVVEDAIIALEIKRNLEDKGYLILFITNTLKKVLDSDYNMDLLIVDLDYIPIHRIGEIKDPIIFLTSQDKNSTDISTLQVTYEFLFKPFNGEQLLYKTGQILKNSKNS